MDVQGRQILRHTRTGDFASQFGDSVRGAATESAMPLAAAAAYYLGCLMGFVLRFPSSGISFFWPPTAVLTAALILISARSWSLVLAASFAAHAVAHAQDGVPAAYWPVQFLGNTVQAVLAALVVRRYSGATLLFADINRVLTFIVGACVLAPALASLIPAYGYVAMGWADDFSQAWRVRTISNAIAMLTIVPSLAWMMKGSRCKKSCLPSSARSVSTSRRRGARKRHVVTGRTGT